MRYVVGAVAFMAVWWAGYALGIRPTLGEALLVIAASAAMSIAESVYATERRIRAIKRGES